MRRSKSPPESPGQPEALGHNLEEFIVAAIAATVAATTWVKIDFTKKRRAWKPGVGDEPGWYFFRTDTPTSVLSQLPHDEIKNHIRLAKRVALNRKLECLHLSGAADESGLRIVYNGEAHKLRARMCSHIYGGSGTGCLSLISVPYEAIRSYDWYVGWARFRDVLPAMEDDKGMRVLLEQSWRTSNGWPVLCAE